MVAVLRPRAAMRMRTAGLVVGLLLLGGPVGAQCLDTDLDGTCDEVDLCTNPWLIGLTETMLRLTGLDPSPRDVMLCDVVTLADVQEAYRARHGGYRSADGSCVMPGFKPASDWVSCSMWATADDVSISVTSPFVPAYECFYSGGPAGLRERIRCGY